MKSVWKFVLQPNSGVQMPKRAKVLSVHAQGSSVCLWALVDTEAVFEHRDISIYGTGHELPDEPMNFIGTVHLYNSELVFHVFERFAYSDHASELLETAR